MSHNQRQRLFRVLYKRYSAKVRARIMRVINNDKHAAEDLTQEVFMRAYVHIDSLYKKDIFLKWVYVVARNLSYNYRRDNRIGYTDSLDFKGNRDDNSMSLIEKIADTREALPDETAQRNELFDSLKQAMLRLSPNYRTVIELCGINGMAYNEAATLLNTSISSIAHNFMRAKKQISYLLT